MNESTVAQPKASTDLTDNGFPLERASSRGKLLVVVGWSLTVLGIVAYCVANLTTAPAGEAGSALVTSLEAFTRGSQIAMASGVGCWLIGSLLYLRVAMAAPEPADHAASPSPR